MYCYSRPIGEALVVTVPLGLTAHKFFLTQSPRILLKWEIIQCPNITKMGDNTMAIIYSKICMTKMDIFNKKIHSNAL